jgi:F-type H+-transporting ATPase subunit c
MEAHVSDLAQMGKFLGAGLACLALIGAALGIGNIFSSYLTGAFRNPSVADSQKGNLILGAALAEAAGLFGFIVAALMLFVV